MADGGRAGREAWRHDGVRLAAANTPSLRLWARCGCGRESPISPGLWIAQGLGRQAVEALEDRLRCLCGARRARLEIRPLAETPKGGAGGIYVFR